MPHRLLEDTSEADMPSLLVLWDACHHSTVQTLEGRRSALGAVVLAQSSLGTRKRRDEFKCNPCSETQLLTLHCSAIPVSFRSTPAGSAIGESNIAGERKFICPGHVQVFSCSHSPATRHGTVVGTPFASKAKILLQTFIKIQLPPLAYLTF